MEKLQAQGGKFGKWIKTSITARMFMIGILIIILLIPLSFIKKLIYERKGRQKEVVEEISNKWGNEVLFYGPMLKVPYKTYQVKKIFSDASKQYREERTEEIKYAYFFPEKLQVKSTINPEEKKRGIYKTAVYKSGIHVSGSFERPDFSEIEVDEDDVLWGKSKLIIEVSNLKGVNNLVSLQLHKNNYTFNAKRDSQENSGSYYQAVKLHKLESKFLKKEDLPLSNNSEFNLDLQINGSKQIRFIPVGKETNVEISSNWKTANFLGEYLPYNSDKITDNGFHAKWKVLAINRPFSQQFFSGIPDLRNYAFGVNFMIPVDEYQKSERSAKYGFLVIGLTFLVFFLIQTMSKILIHPFQYLMIGIALVMFYTLLISISEHSSFFLAYIVASIAVILLITLYSKSIFENYKFPILVGTSLTVLYLFIYIIIQLESYALLVGSVGLFMILATVMFASRKIDWENNN
ncbi:cell envelope integrity protein CreD [Tenacibaculum xiamenense]|uniref:cell envelope integrity protein CreD n=1 Tax=Tenacibaculum xiamenense TaxID=1261553 RepID=UPI0038965124